MTQSIIIREYGGPDVLQLEAVEVGKPSAGQLRIRQTAVGVNFHDVYVRSGSYRSLKLPGIPGCEAVGVVEEVGPNVEGFKIGQRVAYLTPTYGGYAEARVLNADLAILLPESISDVAAASVYLKGLTACMLLRQVYDVKAGDTILVHAAAGAVGQLLCAWAKHLGARVIGTAGSAEKANVALSCGASDVILYRTDDVAQKVMEMTDGRGVNAAYDSVGRDTFKGSLDSLGLFGALINYGQASGPIEGFGPSDLAKKSNTLTFPVIFHYVQNRADLVKMAGELFAVIEAGVIRPQTDLLVALKDTAEAHRALEARKTTGSIVLLP